MAKGLKVGESYWSLIFGARAIIADRLSVPIYHICIQPLHICQSTQLLLISSGSRETVHPDIPFPRDWPRANIFLYHLSPTISCLPSEPFSGKLLGSEIERLELRIEKNNAILMLLSSQDPLCVSNCVLCFVFVCVGKLEFIACLGIPGWIVSPKFICI